MSLLRAALPPCVALLAACSASPAATPPASGAGAREPAWAPQPTAATPYDPRPQLDGRGFPDRVIALTYDDGPDVHTRELAELLRASRVSATFFVVARWSPTLSSDPGEGPHAYDTGHTKIPILGDLVALGHRLGNHTATHPLLGGTTMERDFEELRANQAAIDPHLTSEARWLRVPGGEWTPLASRAVDEDPALRSLVGPIRWDVDRKDWDGSLACDSPRPAAECERGPGGRLRRKASVTAARYLASIEEAGRGIVLFHDRVGDVGSTYALDVARRVIPALVARGFVFAPPVLAFSPMARRGEGDLGEGLAIRDVDGDGRGDVCGARACLRSIAAHADGEAMARVALVPFADGARTASGERPAGAHAGDLNGDGRDDACERTTEGVACALATPRGLAAASIWLPPSALAPGAEWALGDVSGDGRADLCARTASGVDCALAP